MPYYSQKGVALFKKIMTVELLWIDCFHHDSRVINYNRRFFIRLRSFYERRQVWLDLTKIHHFGEILYAIGKFLNAFIFCKLLYQLWHFYAYGKIIIVVNCQRLNNNNNNIVIRSQWRRHQTQTNCWKVFFTSKRIFQTSAPVWLYRIIFERSRKQILLQD